MSLFSAAQCYESPCISSNSIALTPDGQVWYNSDLSIGGIQLEIQGATISEAWGGEAVPPGFLINVSPSNLVIAFSLFGEVIPQGCGVLMNLSFEGSGQSPLSELGITNLIVSSFAGQTIALEVVEPCNISAYRVAPTHPPVTTIPVSSTTTAH